MDNARTHSIRLRGANQGGKRNGFNDLGVSDLVTPVPREEVPFVSALQLEIPARPVSSICDVHTKPGASSPRARASPSATTGLKALSLPDDALLRRVHVGKCLQLLYPRIFAAGVLPPASPPLNRIREAVFHGIQTVRYTSLAAFREEVISLMTRHACPDAVGAVLLSRIDTVLATAESVEALYSHQQGLPRALSRRGGWRG
jgi:hypothetical protein